MPKTKKRKTIYTDNQLVVTEWIKIKKEMSIKKGVNLTTPQLLEILMNFYKNNSN